MKKIRINNDIVLRVEVTRLGAAEDFTGKDVRLVLRSPYEQITLPYVISGNILTAAWLGGRQKKTGTYTVTLVEDMGGSSMNTADECGAFALVSRSCDESCLTGAQTVDCAIDMAHRSSGETVDLDIDISVPANGLSAYEIAVRNGYAGTEQEWLASLGAEADVSVALLFSGFVSGESLMTGAADAPDFVAFDTVRGTFVAGVRQDNGAAVYYPDFGGWGAFMAGDYGAASDEGRVPGLQKMYIDNETDTLYYWNGKELRPCWEIISEEEIDNVLGMN